MAKVQYTWKERLRYYYLLKPVDGAKQDAIAVKREKNTLPLATTKRYCATKVVITLGQVDLVESNRN